MADITTVVANASKLPGAFGRDVDAGGAGDLLDTVYIAADDDFEVADGNDADQAKARGIVTSIAGGKTAFVAGDRIHVTFYGPVTGFSGMTPGDTLYQSDTAGALADAAGTNSHKVGFALTATEVFVNPEA
jgi:hypothetical protein